MNAINVGILDYLDRRIKERKNNLTSCNFTAASLNTSAKIGSLISVIPFPILQLERSVEYKTEVINESSPKVYCTWQEVEILVETLASKIKRSSKKYDVILAITNGGIIPARLMARELHIDDIKFIPIRNKQLFIKEMYPLRKDKKYLVVDEIYDTGNTFFKVSDALSEFNCDFVFLISRYKDSNAKTVAKVLNHNKWVVFPWESKRYSP
jgi:uncharacterized protein